MMEGPLLEDKFWTEPSIVDTDGSGGEVDVDKRLKSGSGSDSHVPRSSYYTASASTLLLQYSSLLPHLTSTSCQT